MVVSPKRRAACLNACSSLDEDTIEIATKPKHASHDGSINGLKKAIQDLKASSPNGDQSRRLVPLLVELGNAYGDAQQLEKKQHCLNHALHIQEREFGATHAQCAVLLANLGNAHAQLGEDAKATACYERALAIHEREYGPQHRALIKKAMGIEATERHSTDRIAAGARDLMHRDAAPAASACYERALAIYEREYAPKQQRAAAELKKQAAAEQRVQAALRDAAPLVPPLRPPGGSASPDRLTASPASPGTPSEVSRVVLWLGEAEQQGRRGPGDGRGDAKTLPWEWDDEPETSYFH